MFKKKKKPKSARRDWIRKEIRGQVKVLWMVGKLDSEEGRDWMGVRKEMSPEWVQINHLLKNKGT